VAAVAFRRAAALYDALTDSPLWRADCAALAALLPAGRVLDVGTGPGTSARELARGAPAARVVGLDLSARMLERARRRLALPLVRGDALRLPFRDGAFDGVAGHSLLYLLDDPGAAVAEAARVLRPGGRVAFLEPAAGPPDVRCALAGGPRFAASMALWRAMSGLHRRFSAAELRALVSGAGLEGARAWPVLAGFGLAVTARRPAAGGPPPGADSG
jgi:SAM-dependent methyltransferase